MPSELIFTSILIGIVATIIRFNRGLSVLSYLFIGILTLLTPFIIMLTMAYCSANICTPKSLEPYVIAIAGMLPIIYAALIPVSAKYANNIKKAHPPHQ